MEISKLDFLEGLWRGTGTAQYPTIKTVDYIEELIFKKDNDLKLFFYEQKSWVKNEEGIFNKLIFWESGFIFDKDEYIELCNVQKSGRMEILIGKLSEHNNDNNFEINLVNKNIYNDERVLRSGRQFFITESELKYEVRMSTVNNFDYDIHLNATLTKIKG